MTNKIFFFSLTKMSIVERQTNDFNYVDWIKKAVENNYITYFNYNEFTNEQEFENSVSSVGKIRN